MQENNVDNNKIVLTGKILTEFEFNHKVYGEGFYYFLLEVKRLSNNVDTVPVIISERLVNTLKLSREDLVIIEGQFRSYNNFTNEGHKLVLTVFARNIKKAEELEKMKNPNSIYLNGYICKQPVYRTTPFGREISDMLLAVNRSYNKSDYIPCIAWGRNARFTKDMKVGDNIKIWGRIQSREYQKKISESETVTKTAYEVSVSKMEMVNQQTGA